MLSPEPYRVLQHGLELRSAPMRQAPTTHLALAPSQRDTAGRGRYRINMDGNLALSAKVPQGSTYVEKSSANEWDLTNFNQ